MTSARQACTLVVGITLALAAVLWPLAARAETKMSDLNGEWRGSGTGRDLPIQSFEPITCRTTIRADLRSMTSEMICDGRSGLHKVVVLKATQAEDRLTGTVRQTTTKPGSSPSELNGTISGHRTDTTASFLVHWSGWQPNTTVALKLSNPNAYSMHVSSLGITMLNVAFTRSSKR